jgi:hypothetical protein
LFWETRDGTKHATLPALDDGFKMTPETTAILLHKGVIAVDEVALGGRTGNAPSAPIPLCGSVTIALKP